MGKCKQAICKMEKVNIIMTSNYVILTLKSFCETILYSHSLAPGFHMVV